MRSKEGLSGMFACVRVLVSGKERLVDVCIRWKMYYISSKTQDSRIIRRATWR